MLNQKDNHPVLRIPSIVLFTLAVCLLVLSALARQETVLPFRVTVGGQAAALPSEKTPFAVLDAPVAPDAPLEVEADDDTVLVNIFAADAKGNALPNARPLVIMITKGSAVTLGATMDGRKLEPGPYVMNVVSPTLGTARVFFTVR